MSDSKRCNHFNAVRWNPLNDVIQCHLCGEVFVPQSEVERLRAREAALVEIAKAIVSVPDADYDEQCPFCREMPGYTPIEHTPDCPVTKARALLAESEGQE